MSTSGPRDLDPEKTKMTSQVAGADSDKTHALADLGAIAELRATVATPAPTDTLNLPLYAAPDTVIVGRGTACDWQLDDASLSRKHAQFRWSGTSGKLTVEDLGSANGTRVNGRPVRGETPVSAGEQVQLGTVIITLELRQKKSADEQATRLVQQPDRPFLPEESDPSLTPLPAAATVVRPQPAPGAPNQLAQVFRPEKDAARPDEPTRKWDARAALVRAPERAFDGEWLEQLKNMWRTNRRPLVLAGAAAWIALLLIIWASVEKGQAVDEDPFAGAPMPTTKAPRRPAAAKEDGTAAAKGDGVAKPMVTQLPVTPPPTRPPTETPPAVHAPSNPPPTSPPTPEDSARADSMERAIAAYDQGRLPEALALFKQLAADPKDASSKFMVDLIEARQAATP
jgi:pSer/pThr/pTyr-binding forkhead associated (FHA) protein